MKKFLLISYFLFPFSLFAGGFIPTTLIHTPVGVRLLSNLEKEETILAMGLDTTLLKRKIKKIKKKEVFFVVHISAGDDLLSMAADQKLYVSNRGWISAKAIEEGDQLLTKDGITLTVHEHKITYHRQLVYLINIETPHTYCVGRYGIIAHNPFF